MRKRSNLSGVLVVCAILLVGDGAVRAAIISGTFNGELTSAVGFFGEDLLNSVLRQTGLYVGGPVTGSWSVNTDVPPFDPGGVPNSFFRIDKVATWNSPSYGIALGADGLPRDYSAVGLPWEVNLYEGGRLQFSVNSAVLVAQVTFYSDVPDTAFTGLMLAGTILAMGFVGNRVAG